MKLSIIIPVYNCKDSITRCINSVKKQSYNDYEVIVIDDGSTDGTSELLDYLCSSDPKFTVVHQSNKGVGSARNIGLSFASGEIIGWVDSDDYVHEDYFEVMVKNIEEHDVDISMCDVVVEREGRFRYDYQIGNKSKSLNVLEALKLLCVDDNCKSWLMNKCFKRHLFEGISFPERKVLEDYSILHEIFSKARGIFYTRETFYCYEENPTSLTHHVSLEDRWSWVYPAAERYEFIKKNWPSLKEIAFNSFIEIVDGCFITAIEQGFDIDFWSSPERKEFLNKYKHEIILNIFRGDNIMCVWRRRRFVLFSNEVLVFFLLIYLKVKRNFS